MSDVALAKNVTAARDEHLVPGREIHLGDMHGHPFCEVGLITGADPDKAVANVWITAGVCVPTVETAGALDGETIARDHGAAGAWVSPLRQSLFDSLDIREAGEDRTFGGITGTWTGVAGATALMRATVHGSYEPEYLYRNGSVTFNRGRKVYVLDAPDGEVFVMHSVAQQGDAIPDEHDLSHLGGRLDLPAGWGFRAETLDQDLEVHSNPENLVHVVQDDMHNVYLGTDAGRAFSLLIPHDSLW